MLNHTHYFFESLYYKIYKRKQYPVVLLQLYLFETNFKSQNNKKKNQLFHKHFNR